MLIKCVQLELASKYEIDLDTDGHAYGVDTAQPIFLQTLGKSNVEQVGMLCLDHTNRIINYSTIAIGNTENVAVSIPQIIRIVLLSNADKIIIAHNHPSGSLDITSHDLKLTHKIGQATKLFNIQLIDSLIINSDGNVLSIRERIGEKR